MAAASKRRSRARGRSVRLQSGSFQVRVFVGRDPITEKRHYLQETVRGGPEAEGEARRTLRRLLVQVYERLNPRTSATVQQLLEKHSALVEVERTTRSTYENFARTHMRSGPRRHPCSWSRPSEDRRSGRAVRGGCGDGEPCTAAPAGVGVGGAAARGVVRWSTRYRRCPKPRSMSLTRWGIPSRTGS